MPSCPLSAPSGDALSIDPDLRVVWVSPSYGYGGDLLYFKGLFETFCVRFPATRIFVDPAVHYREAAQLPLVPGLSGWLIDRNRLVGGAAYNAGVHIPSPRFAWQLIAARPQLAITIEFTLASLAAIALSSWGRGFAVLLLVEGDPAARGGSSNRLVLGLKRWACRRAHAIQTSNVSGRQFLIEQLHADPAKIRVAPYLTSAPPRPARAIARSDPRLHLLFANSLTPRKGAAALIAGIALLPPALARRIRLTIVGDGPERAELESAASHIDGTEVRFVGARAYASLGQYYADADVLAVPSHADYRSLAGFEGLAYGLALLASRHDGASAETLDGGATGFGIDPRDPATIADALRRLLEEPALLSRCQAAAAELFAERFSYERIVDSLAGSVQAAIARRRAGSAGNRSSGRQPSDK